MQRPLISVYLYWPETNVNPCGIKVSEKIMCGCSVTAHLLLSRLPRTVHSHGCIFFIHGLYAHAHMHPCRVFERWHIRAFRVIIIYCNDLGMCHESDGAFVISNLIENAAVWTPVGAGAWSANSVVHQVWLHLAVALAYDVIPRCAEAGSFLNKREEINKKTQLNNVS